MKRHSIIGKLCLIASVASLVLVYGPSIYWPVLIALPAMLLLWMVAKKTLAAWRPSAVLCVYLVLAVMGVILRHPLLPLILGSIAALIWWDLTDFEEGLHAGILAKAESSLQKYRLQSFVLTIGATLLLEIAGLSLRLPLPFGVVVLLMLLATGCLVSLAGSLRNRPLD